MKILITGGCGYVGNALINELHSKQEIEEILIYDNLSKGKQVLIQQSFKSPKIQFVEADILDNHSLQKTLKRVDTIIHLATINVSSEHHHQMEQINHWGTANICNLIEDLPIKKFIFLSTTQIYGESEKHITTDNPDNPNTPYAQSMLRAEKYVKTLSNKCDVKIIRTPDIYGYNPVMQLEKGLNKHIFEAKYNKLLRLNADGLHTQSSVHITDLVRLFIHLIMNEIEQETFLLATEHWNGMEIYETLKSFYPNLEATFISHHLRLTDNHIISDDTTSNIIHTHTELKDSITEFLDKTNL